MASPFTLFCKGWTSPNWRCSVKLKVDANQLIFSEAARVSGGDLSNNTVAFHGGGNNQWVTNSIMQDTGVSVIDYRDHPFDPVPNLSGFNTFNPIKIIGSVLAIPLVGWGGPRFSPHTLPYLKTYK